MRKFYMRCSMQSGLFGIAKLKVFLGALLTITFLNVFPQTPYLGEAEKFGVLSGSAVLANTATEVKGWVGAQANIDNKIISTDPIMKYADSPCIILKALSDFVKARQDLHNKMAVPIPKNINGGTYGPGVYEVAQPAQMGGTIKLQGGPQDEFVFNFKQNLVIKPNTKLELLGGVKSENVYFNVETQLNIGANSEIHGNFLAGGNISALNIVNAEESRIHGGGNVNLGGIPKTGLIAISNVFPMPQAVINASGSTAFCQGGAVILSANNGAKYYQWNTGAATQSITVTQSGTYTVTITFQNNCTSSISQQVTVNSLPTAKAGNDTTIFSGQSVQIGSTPTAGNTYLWSPATGLSDATIANPIASPDSNITYILTVENGTGCINKDTVTVNSVKCNPAFQIVTIDTIACGQMDSLGNQYYYFSLFAHNPTNVDGNILINAVNFTITNISSTYLAPGINTITGTFIANPVSNSIGCFDFNITFQNAADTCTVQLCFLLPDCSGNVCGNNLLENGTLSDSNVPGTMPGTGSIADWTAGYGNPVVSEADGCDETGFVKMQGNKIGGDAIMQVLSSGKKIIQGKRYMLSFCGRLDPALSNLPYVKFRAIAFNGTLPPVNDHPEPNTNIAIIGFSGKITSSDWASIQFFPWFANYNFDNIAINIYNNNNVLLSVGDIDDICLREITEDFPCDSIPTDALGNPIIPSDLAALLDPDNPPITDTVDMFMGNVNDLYSFCCGNTDIDTFYADCPCIDCGTIGGTVPDSALNINMEDSLAALGINITSDSINNVLNFISDSIYNTMIDSPLVTLFSLGALDTLCYCDTATNFIPTNDPFQGRDIVYVHGLRSGTIVEKILDNTSRAKTIWPLDKKEFFDDWHGNQYLGFWKENANIYWKDHIEDFLTIPGHKNRYLIIAWPSTQTIEFGVHTMLAQIGEAMNNGQGVIDPSGTLGTDGFGKNGYVIISHSTGALVANLAMSSANQTKSNPIFRAALGNRGYISDKAKVHVSLHGAISGSRLATVALTIFTQPEMMALAAIANTFLNINNASVYSTVGAALVARTCVWRDLDPKISQFWMTSLGQFTPVPVLTVAGGHPDFVSLPFKHIMHPGFDDGVLTMDCQCGNFNPYLLWPSGYVPKPSLFYAKVFDMGIARERAIDFYVDQISEQKFLANVSAACVPYLSTTGMVQPVLFNNPVINSKHRYLNHYSFLQSASDHRDHDSEYKDSTQNTNPLVAGYIPLPDYAPTIFTKAANTEEVRCITNNDVYNLGLVSNDMKNLMREDIKGLNYTITIRLWPFKKKITKKFWIWKRTYHRQEGFENMSENNYVYKYVLKQ